MSFPAKAGCSNCENEWSVQIPKETTIVKWKEKAVCPKCGASDHIWAIAA